MKGYLRRLLKDQQMQIPQMSLSKIHIDFIDTVDSDRSNPIHIDKQIGAYQESIKFRKEICKELKKEQ